MPLEVCRKTQHRTKGDALRHIKNMFRRHRGKGGGIYKCPTCGYFHITSNKDIKKTTPRDGFFDLD